MCWTGFTCARDAQACQTQPRGVFAERPVPGGSLQLKRSCGEGARASGRRIESLPRYAEIFRGAVPVASPDEVGSRARLAVTDVGSRSFVQACALAPRAGGPEESHSPRTNGGDYERGLTVNNALREHRRSRGFRYTTRKCETLALRFVVLQTQS